MELRDFKKWLIDNELEKNELYAEAIKCYQVEAYRAAYLYTYLGNMKYINEEIIAYKGIPKSFEKNIQDEKVKNKEWLKKIENLKNEDLWEEKTYELITNNEKKGNIFELKGQIRDLFSDMKRLRNASAHDKERRITESTVQELWNNIIYVKPYFKVNGTEKAWLSEFNKLVKYARNTAENRAKVITLVEELNFFSDENKKKLMKEILDIYIENNDYLAENQFSIIKYFFSKYIENQQGNEINWLDDIDKLLISLVVDNPQLLSNTPFDFVTVIDEKKGDYVFREICANKADAFFNVINVIKDTVNEEKISDIIFEYINKNGKILSNSNYSKHPILNSNPYLIRKIMDKISHLYYYRMNATGQKRYCTDTLDYTRYFQYSHLINYIFYYINSNPELKKEDEIKEIILRCQKILVADYSGEMFQTELLVQNSLRDINDEFKII